MNPGFMSAGIGENRRVAGLELFKSTEFFRTFTADNSRVSTFPIVLRIALLRIALELLIAYDFLTYEGLLRSAYVVLSISDPAEVEEVDVERLFIARQVCVSIVNDRDSSKATRLAAWLVVSQCTRLLRPQHSARTQDIFRDLEGQSTLIDDKMLSGLIPIATVMNSEASEMLAKNLMVIGTAIQGFKFRSSGFNDRFRPLRLIDFFRTLDKSNQEQVSDAFQDALRIIKQHVRGGDSQSDADRAVISLVISLTVFRYSLRSDSRSGILAFLHQATSIGISQTSVDWASGPAEFEIGDSGKEERLVQRGNQSVAIPLEEILRPFLEGALSVVVSAERSSFLTASSYAHRVIRAAMNKAVDKHVMITNNFTLLNSIDQWTSLCRDWQKDPTKPSVDGLLATLLAIDSRRLIQAASNRASEGQELMSLTERLVPVVKAIPLEFRASVIECLFDLLTFVETSDETSRTGAVMEGLIRFYSGLRPTHGGFMVDFGRIVECLKGVEFDRELDLKLKSVLEKTIVGVAIQEIATREKEFEARYAMRKMLVDLPIARRTFIDAERKLKLK
jgi:hypothetical protein